MASRILVIDDEQDVTELISTFLSFYNLEVDTINDPTEVESRMQNKEYQLIILDLMMPKIDGFEIIRRVKGNPKQKHIPIIVITAKSLTDEERKFLVIHGVYLLIKPYEPQTLLDQVTLKLEKSSS